MDTLGKTSGATIKEKVAGLNSNPKDLGKKGEECGATCTDKICFCGKI